MNECSAAADWSAARGEKWRAQSGGMEAMLAPVDEPLIRALNLDAPYRIADIGCGGGTTLEILQQLVMRVCDRTSYPPTTFAHSEFAHARNCKIGAPWRCRHSQ